MDQLFEGLGLYQLHVIEIEEMLDGVDHDFQDGSDTQCTFMMFHRDALDKVAEYQAEIIKRVNSPYVFQYEADNTDPHDLPFRVPGAWLFIEAEDEDHLDYVVDQDGNVDQPHVQLPDDYFLEAAYEDRTYSEE